MFSYRNKLGAMASAVAIAVALHTLSACGAGRVLDPSGPARDASPVRTGSVLYRLVRVPGAYRAYATATYVNRSSSSVYFARCSSGSPGPIFGVRRSGPDSTRKFFTDQVWACVGGVPTGEIEPGDSVSVTATLGSFDEPTMQPPLEAGDLVGTFRVVLSLCRSFVSDSDECEALPEAQRISNAFVVTY